MKLNLGLVLLIVSLLAGAYGFFNIYKLASTKEKAEIKYDTGDKPLPQEITLWVTADGGLYLREGASSKSKILKLIPNGTELLAKETDGEWYKVTYMDKTGWIHKSFTTSTAPKEDPTKDWTSYKNKAFGYSLRYPKEWVSQDYGENPASGSLSYVGFGPQLSPTIDPLRLPPVIVKISKSTKESLESTYKTEPGSTSEAVTVSALSGTKYSYTTPSGTQVTVILVSKGDKTYIFEETGGFVDELLGIVKSVNLS